MSGQGAQRCQGLEIMGKQPELAGRHRTWALPWGPRGAMEEVGGGGWGVHSQGWQPERTLWGWCRGAAKVLDGGPFQIV